MLDKIRELLDNNKDLAVENKEARIKYENTKRNEMLEKAKEKSIELNTVIFKLLKRLYLQEQGAEDSYSTKLGEGHTNNIRVRGSYVPYHKINLSPVVIQDYNSIKYNSEITKYYTIDFLNIVEKYNKEHSDDKIAIFPGFPIFYSIFYIKAFQDMGFNVKANEDGISLFISNNKLVEILGEITDSKTYTNPYITMGQMEPLITAYRTFQNKHEIIRKYEEQCKENYEIVSLDIYRKLLENYKSSYKSVNKNFDFKVTVTFKDDENSVREEVKKAYNYYEAACNEKELKEVIFIRHSTSEYSYEYLPVFTDDIDELKRELKCNTSFDPITSDDEKAMIIVVNSEHFENLLLNSDEETKTK